MQELKRIVVFGVSSKTAPLPVRRSIATKLEEIGDFLARAARELPELEYFGVSDESRTELVLSLPMGTSSPAPWCQLLSSSEGLIEMLGGQPSFHRYEGPEAVRYLFRIAAGLESPMPGDPRPALVLEKAMQEAMTRGTSGKHLQHLMRHALRSGKKARRLFPAVENGQGPTIGTLVSALVEEHRPSHMEERPLRILLVGAGGAAREIGKELAKRRQGRITVINRTGEKAEFVALECGGKHLPWSTISSLAPASDVIVTASKAIMPVLSPALLRRIETLCGEKPPLIIDVGQPPNVAWGSSLPVLSLENLRHPEWEELRALRDTVPAADLRVEEEVTRWQRWNAGRAMVPIFLKLYEEASVAAQEEEDVLIPRPLARTRVGRLLQSEFKRVVQEKVAIS